MKKLLTALSLLLLLLLLLLSTAQASVSATTSNIDLLAKLVAAEARGEPYKGQLAVANVVMNRLESGKWGDTLQSVIFAPGQFSPVKTKGGRKYIATKATESSRKAAIEAIKGERVLPNYVLYFCRGSFKWARLYKRIGNHGFFYLSKDKLSCAED